MVPRATKCSNLYILSHCSYDNFDFIEKGIMIYKVYALGIYIFLSFIWGRVKCISLAFKLRHRQRGATKCHNKISSIKNTRRFQDTSEVAGKSLINTGYGNHNPLNRNAAPKCSLFVFLLKRTANTSPLVLRDLLYQIKKLHFHCYQVALHQGQCVQLPNVKV